MERTLGVEEARGRLGELAAEVAAGADPIVLTKRGRALAVLVDRDQYARFKEHSSRVARGELQKLLPQIQSQIEQEGLDRRLIRDAIDAAKRLA
jgi:prevent-host-death family protein